MQEKSILCMQSMLSSIFFRQACPLSIISGSPNIMDLVKCDGAALLYGDKVWQLHTTPTVTQIRDIATWLSDVHRDSTSLSFDSLRDAAYPGLASLGDMICGMSMAKVTSSIILFWLGHMQLLKLNGEVQSTVHLIRMTVEGCTLGCPSKHLSRLSG